VCVFNRFIRRFSGSLSWCRVLPTPYNASSLVLVNKLTTVTRWRLRIWKGVFIIGEGDQPREYPDKKKISKTLVHTLYKAPRYETKPKRACCPYKGRTRVAIGWPANHLARAVRARHGLL